MKKRVKSLFQGSGEQGRVGGIGRLGPQMQDAGDKDIPIFQGRQQFPIIVRRIGMNDIGPVIYLFESFTRFHQDKPAPA